MGTLLAHVFVAGNSDGKPARLMAWRLLDLNLDRT